MTAVVLRMSSACEAGSGRTGLSDRFFPFAEQQGESSAPSAGITYTSVESLLIELIGGIDGVESMMRERAFRRNHPIASPPGRD